MAARKTAQNIDSINRELRARIRNGKPNLWSHGNGLCFSLAKNRSASWCLRYTINGKRRLMTLAPVELPIGETDLKSLELETAKYREKIKTGVDPIAERQAETSAAKTAKSGDTFEDIARDYIATQKTGWKNAKHRQQWANTLETYVFPKIGHMLPHEISVDDVLNVLKQSHVRNGLAGQLWEMVPETASRVRMRIETIISASKAKGVASNEAATRELWQNHHNPAKWKDGLEHLIPKPRKTNGKGVKHHEALKYINASDFVNELRTHADYSAKALYLTILCATRTGETLNATWSEIDIENGIWTIPATRMKAGREHRIPLSTEAIALLKSLSRFEHNAHIFPGAKRGKPLSQMAMLEKLRGMRDGTGLTVHGFRSTFRDWIADTTVIPDAIAEMALAHINGDKVAAAYKRGEAFDRRKLLMQQWSDYLQFDRRKYEEKWDKFLVKAIEL